MNITTHTVLDNTKLSLSTAYLVITINGNANNTTGVSTRAFFFILNLFHNGPQSL